MIRFRHRGSTGGAKPTGFVGKLGASLFFFVFFAMGSLFEVFIVREFARAVGQRFWTRTPCRIVQSKIEDRNDNEEPCAFVVRYEYAYGGQTYEGSSYRRNYSGSENYSKAQRLAQQYFSGREATCYVNAKNPADAVLERDSLLVGLVLFFPLIFVAIGAGGIYFIWRPEPEAKVEPLAAPVVRHGRKGRHAMVAFFSIFAIAGLGMLYPLGIRPIAKTLDARSWIETPCKVLRGQVRSHSSDDGTTYSVYLLYEYEFEGRLYKSDRYDFIGGSSSGHSRKAQVVEQYKTAVAPVCYVNPKKPAEAILKRGFHAKLLFALFPLPFVCIGLGGIYFTLRRKTRTGSEAWKPRMRAAPAQSETLSVLHAGEGGRVVLKPRHSPVVKFLGAVLIAAFWNGIVSVFLVEVVAGFRQGNPRWGMTLFMTPFVLIGIGLIALIVYQFLAIFNPRPRLELSSASIPLGGAAELSWRLFGRVSRIGQFAVTLRGSEEATYRRGTDTRTDRSTFYEMELYKTSSPAEMASGQVGIILPQETMHSFEADHNKIVWNLEVYGDIPRWPDVKESFKITVAQAAG